LAAGEGVDEEFALEFGDAGPIFHVAFGFRADRCALIVGWEAGDSAFDVADGGQVFVDARSYPLCRGLGLEAPAASSWTVSRTLFLRLIQGGVRGRRTDGRRGLFGMHFGRESAVVPGPAHVALDGFRRTIPAQTPIWSERKRVSAAIGGDDADRWRVRRRCGRRRPGCRP
jgi:hypothetical protein